MDVRVLHIKTGSFEVKLVFNLNFFFFLTLKGSGKDGNF